MTTESYVGGEDCSECGEPVHVGDHCPECFVEDCGAVVHDRCCQLVMEIPYSPAPELYYER